MKYSVLMSVYKKDNPDFLRIALQSIYEKQTRKPDEIIVVFDGPLTDELNNVLNEFIIGKEEIVKYYPQIENKGLGEALRVGAEKCNGDYIFRMDSDDISKEDRFEKQIEYLEKNPDVDVLGADIAEFNVSLDETMRIRACPEKHDDIVQMGKKRNPMNHVTACIKKEALIKSGSYKPLLFVEDYYLWLRMIVQGCKLANINETLVYVRVGNGFATRRSSKKQIAGWKTLQKFMVDNRLIGKFKAWKNMMYIRIFVAIPPKMKDFIYKKFLRKTVIIVRKTTEKIV